MPRLSRDYVAERIAASAVIPESFVVTLSDGTQVPFTVVPWDVHKRVAEQTAAFKMAGAGFAEAIATGPAALLFHSILDETGKPLFDNVEQVEEFIRRLSGDNLSVIMGGLQRVMEMAGLVAVDMNGNPESGPPVSLAEVGKAPSTTSLA